MKIDSKVVKNYENGYVKIEISSLDSAPKYYRVPENKADEFQSEYKKNKSKMDWINGGILLGSILGVILAASALTKNIANKAVRAVSNIAAGVAGGIISLFISNKIEQNNYEKFMQKYEAEEISKNKTQR